MLLHAGTIFLSAFLLFLVQPIIAKQILPWFGGSAAVWAVCLVFFQSVLLAGYAYADVTARYLTPRRQAWLHVAVLAASLAVLPIIPDASWKPDGSEDPSLLILGLLLATIGLPYFVLSTTSPLVQAWFWQRFKQGVPYRLFALSNFASLLALLAYPVLVEPWLPLTVQSKAWSWLYSLFALLCAIAGITSARNSAPARAKAAEPAAQPGQAPRWTQYLWWMSFAAVGSCMLLAVTNHITQNIAAIPFLWVVPLSVYLLTFILAFDHPRWYKRGVYLILVALAVPAMAWNIDSLNLHIAAPLYTVGLFAVCTFVHGELTLMKPDPRYLTTFYLMISVGGALGSFLIGVIAPNVLPGYYELGIVLIVTAVLGLVRVLGMAPIATAVAAGVLVATSVVVWNGISAYASQARVVMRNFYGVVRTKDFAEPVPYRAMYHGGIMHGGQLLEPDAQMLPSSYFGPTSGYGRLFASLPPAPRNVGVIGLGAGAVAVYGRPGDHFVFYEIDPQVIEVAQKEFTFLGQSKAKVETVLGDGRLALERAPDGYFDVLAMDAFSGDAIPMHLLTRESIAMYVRKLKPDGAIIFQATNRFVDISPVVAQLAAEHGMKAVMVSDSPDAGEGRDYWLAYTDQIIISRNPKILEAEPIRAVAEPIVPPKGFRAWTDDYYNLLGILK